MTKIEEKVKKTEKKVKKTGKSTKKQALKYNDFVDFFQKQGRFAGISFGSPEYIFAERMFILARLKKDEQIPIFSKDNDYKI